MPVVVVCTHCEAKMKIPDNTIGKKIRCKNCEGIFTAKLEKQKASKQTEDEAKAESAEDAAKKDKRLYETDDLELNENPYAVNKDDEDALPRCPFCAKELASETARICLNCGYDTVTRTRNQTKAVYQPTVGEWIMRLLPGIICVLTIIGIITGCIISAVMMKRWVRQTWLEYEDTWQRPLSEAKWNIHPGIISGWGCVFGAFICWKLGKFAYKRLVIEYRPIEKKIKGDD